MWRHNCRLYNINHVEVTGNHVVYDRDAWFLRVIMSSSLALFCLPSVKKHKHEILLFRSMYNKTIIRFGFCDIQNNQGLGKGYPKWRDCGRRITCQRLTDNRIIRCIITHQFCIGNCVSMILCCVSIILCCVSIILSCVSIILCCVSKILCCVSKTLCCVSETLFCVSRIVCCVCRYGPP